jgi:hypothetical protein
LGIELATIPLVHLYEVERMSFRNVMLLSLAVMMSLPAWSAEKKSHQHANRGPASLDRIYQSLIRDSRKQLTPSTNEHGIYLPTASSTSASRSPASERSALPVRTEGRYPGTVARHAAMPWAAEANGGGAVFSVK